MPYRCQVQVRTAQDTSEAKARLKYNKNNIDLHTVRSEGKGRRDRCYELEGRDQGVSEEQATRAPPVSMNCSAIAAQERGISLPLEGVALNLALRISIASHAAQELMQRPAGSRGWKACYSEPTGAGRGLLSIIPSPVDGWPAGTCNGSQTNSPGL